MSFKVGDRVLMVNDTGRAKVLEVLPNEKLKIEDENGFDYIISTSEVMKEQGNLRAAMSNIDDYDLNMAAAKDVPKKSRLDEQISTAEAYTTYSADTLEVDLHIENLVDYPKKMEPAEIIQLQIKVFEKMLEKAITQRKRKLIAIHGVGQGVLRTEIRNLLEFYPQVIFQDASYKSYGYGATEVLIKQNAHGIN